MTKRWVFTVVCGFLLSTGAAAQQAAVEGHVVAADGGFSLDVVLIELRQTAFPVAHQQGEEDRDHEQIHDHGGHGEVTITDQDGHFAFPGVAPGEYLLRALLDGYYVAQQVLVLQPRQSIALTIELTALAVVTEEVDVTVPTPAVDPQSTGSVRVLTSRALDEMTMSGIVDVPTLAEFEVPGAVTGHDNLVHVRGNELSLHQFINGVAFLDNGHRHFSPGLSPQIFDIVNIISGGFPAEFGNRFGGILDMTTRSGRSFGGHGSATLGLGTVEGRDGSFEYGGSAGGWGYYMYGGAFHSGRFLNSPEPDALHAAGRNTQAVAQIDYQGDADLVKLFVSGGDSGFELANTLAQDEDGRDARRELQSATGIINWQHVLSTRSFLTASFYSRRVSDDLLPTTDLHTTFADGSRQTRTQGGKLDWFQSIGGHRFKAGADVSRYRLTEALDFDPRESEDDDLHPTEDEGKEHHGALERFAFSGRGTTELVSAYLQDRFNPAANVTVDVGVRLDHVDSSDSYTELSPRVGLAYHFPKAGSVVRFVYNRLFTPPPIENLLLANFLGNIAEDEHDRVGNVKPYTQHHIEGGLGQEVHPDLDIAIAAYRHVGEHAFETSEISNTYLFVPTNFAEARAYGFESGVNYRPQAERGLSGRVQYSLAKVEFIGPVTGGVAAEQHGPGEVISPVFDQRHTLVSSVVYRQPWRGFQIRTVARYGSGTPSERHDEDSARGTFVYLPDHWTFDLNARANLWRQGSWRMVLELTMTNLTNNIYAIAKESEAMPLQYAMPRVIGGRLRVDF